jgi:hypothetical protein
MIPELLVGQVRHRALQDRQRFLASPLFDEPDRALRRSRAIGYRRLPGSLSAGDYNGT